MRCCPLLSHCSYIMDADCTDHSSVRRLHITESSGVSLSLSSLLSSRVQSCPGSPATFAPPWMHRRGCLPPLSYHQPWVLVTISTCMCTSHKLHRHARLRDARHVLLLKSLNDSCLLCFPCIFWLLAVKGRDTGFLFACCKVWLGCSIKTVPRDTSSCSSLPLVLDHCWFEGIRFGSFWRFSF